MAAISTLIAVGGFALSAGSAVAQAEAQGDAAAASQRAEQARRRQQTLEASRQRRRIIREQRRASATATASATALGVSLDSSGVAGGQAQIANNGAFEINSVNQNEQVGASLFDANSDIADARGAGSLAGAVGSAGSAITANAGAIGGLFPSSSANINQSVPIPTRNPRR